MKLHFGRATGIYLQTFPFVLLRLGIGLALGIASLLYFGAIGWMAYAFVDAGTISGWIAIVGLLVALALFVKAWRLLVRYVLYMVKAGHIAVIAHVIETGEVPPNQVSYGIEQVKANFTEASALFAVDQVVKGVLEQFNRHLLSVSNLVDFAPSLEQLVEPWGGPWRSRRRTSTRRSLPTCSSPRRTTAGRPRAMGWCCTPRPGSPSWARRSSSWWECTRSRGRFSWRSRLWRVRSVASRRRSSSPAGSSSGPSC
ncbi:hypothetical protein [Natronosalvus caseinilyticus]|uniref:hypothetical protein n=1 Tax=Natronosalvus caseinilyticus TaxID=2953747 RepID=UPI0028AF029F|nr:hypothetical protein [Natronosalvus caseinilyticus]